MKKFICAGLCILCFLISGCSRDLGKLEMITVDQMKEKMEGKETFIIVFTQPTCGYCNQFKEVLDEYLPSHEVTLLDVSLDRSAMSTEEFNAMLEDIRKYFPDMDGTPDLYYVKDGEIINRFDQDAEGGDLTQDNIFNNWIDKYELNADKDYSKEAK